MSASIDNVTVNVTDATFALPTVDLGIPLILATNEVIAYKEYTSLTDIATDLGTGYADKKAYKMAQVIFAQSPRTGTVAIYGLNSTDGETVTAALDTLVGLDSTNSWYVLLLDTYVEALAIALDNWVATQMKLFAFNGNITAFPEGVDSDRSIAFYNTTANNWPEAAIAGLAGGYQAGSFSWDTKEVESATAESLTSTVRTTLAAADINYLIEVGDGTFTQGGITAGGKLIESMRGRDWIKLTLQQKLFELKAKTQKLTFSDDSIAAIKATAYGVMASAVDRDIILVTDGVPAFNGNFPTASAVDPSDKTAGIYRFSLEYTEAGEVIQLIINLKIE